MQSIKNLKWTLWFQNVKYNYKYNIKQNHLDKQRENVALLMQHLQKAQQGQYNTKLDFILKGVTGSGCSTTLFLKTWADISSLPIPSRIFLYLYHFLLTSDHKHLCLCDCSISCFWPNLHHLLLVWIFLYITYTIILTLTNKKKLSLWSMRHPDWTTAPITHQASKQILLTGCCFTVPEKMSFQKQRYNTIL